MEENFSKRKDELLASMQLEYFIKSRNHTKEEIKRKDTRNVNCLS